MMKQLHGRQSHILLTVFLTFPVLTDIIVVAFQVFHCCHLLKAKDWLVIIAIWQSQGRLLPYNG